MSKAAEAARETERFFGCDRLGLPVVAFGHDGSVRYANEPAIRLAGIDPSSQRAFFDRLYRSRRLSEHASGIRRSGTVELGDGSSHVMWETTDDDLLVVALTPAEEQGPEHCVFPLDELTGLCGRAELLSRLEAETSEAAEARDDIVVYAL